MILDIVNNKNFIKGRWVSSPSTLFVYNPANRDLVGHVPSLNEAMIASAIDAACEAQKSWKDTDATYRSELLMNLYQLILDNREELAEIVVLENGKIYQDALSEINYGAEFVKWFAEKALNIRNSEVDGVKPGQKIVTNYEPVGVVAAITPWNFPNAMITRKISPALAAGCALILKPSEFTPFSGLAIAHLAEKAGFPAGVMNVVTGDAKVIAHALCDDFRVRKLSFTGSTEVGKLLYQNSSKTLKRISLELGGNAPFIIHEDADLTLALDSLISGKLRSTSQACTSPNRIFLHNTIHDNMISSIAERLEKIKCGVDIGPLINQKAVEKVERLLRDALSKGAQIILGGKRDKGTYFEPTLLVGCNDKMDIFREEIFAPVIACYKYDAIDEVIERANNTEYGLSSYIFTNSKSCIEELTRGLDFGMVGVNTGIVSNYKGAFSGRKCSGFGVEGSELGIYEYLNTKYLCVESHGKNAD
ncbi:MAG: hypothetical protein RLZZ59_379 [Pseudomonadota bacterium]|jgi:succinate-semialdehyde dehydrogenase/glutarate-semialdehyde dehydrogenase